MDIINTAFREIFCRRFRHGLTVLAIAVSIAAVVIIGAIGQTGKSIVSRELDSLGLDGITIGASSDSSAELTENELAMIKSMGGVQNATPIVTQVSKTRLLGEKSDCLVWGIDSGCEGLISLNILHGRNISAGDVSMQRSVCLVDRQMALDSYGRENIVGKHIEVLLGSSYIDMEIIGIAKADSSLLQSVSGYIPSFIYVPYTSLLDKTEKEDFGQIAVKLKNGSDCDRLSGSIVTRLESENGEGYYSENLAKQRDKLTNLLDAVTMVLSAIGFISLIVAGLGIMTSMIVSVKERTREIGIKKAIGARKSLIMAEFLTESLIVSLLGCLIGVAAGMIICIAASLLLGIPVFAAGDYLALCLFVSLAAGLIFGVYPAAKAAKLNPVDALKNE